MSQCASFLRLNGLFETSSFRAHRSHDVRNAEFGAQISCKVSGAEESCPRNSFAPFGKTLSETSDTSTAVNKTLFEASDTLPAVNKTLSEASDASTASDKVLSKASDAFTAVNKILSEASDTLPASDKVPSEVSDTLPASNKALSEASDGFTASDKVPSETSDTFSALDKTQSELSDGFAQYCAKKNHRQKTTAAFAALHCRFGVASAFEHIITPKLRRIPYERNHIASAY